MEQSYPPGYPLNLFFDPAFSWPIYPIGCAVTFLVLCALCYRTGDYRGTNGEGCCAVLCIAIWPLVLATGAVAGAFYSPKYVWVALEGIFYLLTLPMTLAASAGARRQIPDPAPASSEPDALPIPHNGSTGDASLPIPCEEYR